MQSAAAATPKPVFALSISRYDDRYDDRYTVTTVVVHVICVTYVITLDPAYTSQIRDCAQQLRVFRT